MKKFKLESYEERKLIELYRTTDQRGKKALIENARFEAMITERKREEQNHDSRKY